jgi:glycosyltransferase involved in cell wall biosynthesis
MDNVNPKIGLLVPTYNHGARVRKVVVSALPYISHILVVVDGATDDTLDQLKELPIKILHFPKNRGKGAALKTGFQEAERLGWDCAITMDSDGQHKAEDILKFIEAIRQNPDTIIVGDRDMSSPDIPSSSKFGKNFTNFWLKVETGIAIADGQSGFRAYPVKAINSLRTWFNRYEFEVEILARAAWSGIPIISIPIQVDYHPEGQRITHFRPFVDNVRTSLLNTILVTMRILGLIPSVVKKKFSRKRKTSCKT